jgi:hypothetical protein
MRARCIRAHASHAAVSNALNCDSVPSIAVCGM